MTLDWVNIVLRTEEQDIPYLYICCKLFKISIIKIK